MAARLALALAAVVVFLTAHAQAQEYQRLHVRSFTLSSDLPRPQLEQPFHVTLTIRFAERLAQVRNVFLPTFFGAEDLGDEQQIVHAGGGTTYRETLTLVSHARGTLTITPAYLDAIDARDGEPKRFLSNSLEIAVGGGAITSPWRTLRTLLLVAIEVVLLAAAIFVVVTIFWRRKRAPLPAPVLPLQTPAPPPAAPPRDAVADAWNQLRERRDRASVLQLRTALWNAAGAGSGETLTDVLRRPAAAPESVRNLLTSVERAAFIEHGRLDRAIEEVLCSPP